MIRTIKKNHNDETIKRIKLIKPLKGSKLLKPIKGKIISLIRIKIIMAITKTVGCYAC